MNCFNIRLLMLGLLCLVMAIGCKSTPVSQSESNGIVSHAKESADILRKIIVASGMDDISHVLEIRFTFNVLRGENKVSRQWTWRPREDKVTLTHPGLTGESISLAFVRSQVTANTDTPTNIRMADRWFINDSFWLMMPVHLSWQNLEKLGVQDHGMVPLPIGEGNARHVTITFPKSDSGGGGYTPGDVYDLYLNDQLLVKQWAFRKAGRQSPNLVNTFDAYAEIGGMHIAMNHENPKGFKLWFSDVTVVTDNK